MILYSPKHQWLVRIQANSDSGHCISSKNGAWPLAMLGWKRNALHVRMFLHCLWAKEPKLDNLTTARWWKPLRPVQTRGEN